jgi:hypothetical protein
MSSALIFVVAGVLLLPVLATVIALTALLWRMYRRDGDDGQERRGSDQEAQAALGPHLHPGPREGAGPDSG